MAATRSFTVVPATGEEAKPYREQIKFLGRDRPYYGFISGSGAGKTFAGVYRLWLNATLWNPDEMGAIIVPDKSQFTDNIKPIMEDFGLMDRWHYNSVYTDEPGLVTDNGQRILILSADNDRQIGRIKGKNLAYIWMDEEAEIDSRAREIADQRLRVGSYPNLFITTTPDGYNHTYDFFKGEVTDAIEEPFGKGKLIYNDDKLAVVGVPSEANPAIDDKHIARQRRNLPEHIVQQEIEGDFVEIGAGVFTRDMLTFTHADDISTDLSMKTIIAVDPAATVDAQRAESQDSDYWACAVVQAVPSQDRVYVTETVRRRGMSLASGCEWIASIANQARGAHVVAEANQAQRWLIEELKDYGVYADPVTSTRNKESRILDLSIPLENGTIEFVDWNAETPEDVGKDHPYQELVGELLSFPEGSHDDMVDALHRAVDFAPVSLGTNILGADPYGNNNDEN